MLVRISLGRVGFGVWGLQFLLNYCYFLLLFAYFMVIFCYYLFTLFI